MSPSPELLALADIIKKTDFNKSGHRTTDNNYDINTAFAKLAEIILQVGNGPAPIAQSKEKVNA